MGWTERYCEEEVEFSLNSIRMAPENQSAWTYLLEVPFSSKTQVERVKMYIEKVLKTFSSGGVRMQALSALVRLQERFSTVIGGNEAFKAALELVSVDLVREKYWAFMTDKLCISSKDEKSLSDVIFPAEHESKDGTNVKPAATTSPSVLERESVARTVTPLLLSTIRYFLAQP